MSSTSSLRRPAAALIACALGVVPAGAGGDRDPSRHAFEALYARATEAVERGDLPQEVGDQARDLWVDTSKELIRIDAEIAMTKVEARGYRDARQERALEALVRAGADRERLLADRIHRLESLTGLRADIPEVAGAPARPAEPGATAGAESAPPAEPPPAETEIKITWDPEDPSASPQFP